MISKKNSGFEKSYFQNYRTETLPYLYGVKIREALKGISKKDPVLDIGCATGMVLSRLDRDGFQTYGLDISKFALSRAKEVTKAHLQFANVNQRLPFPENYFGAVLALDIIEHLNSPVNFCREVRRVLKPKGLFLLHTPNINSIFEKIFGGKWFGYQDKSHLYLFNKKSLQYLLSQAGFKILTMETISYPVPVIFRQLLVGTEIGGSLWVVAEKA